jgi:hypothetical protein
MENIKNILMKRDGIDEIEATGRIKETTELVSSCIKCGDIKGAEKIFEENIGLESDYLVDFF